MRRNERERTRGRRGLGGAGAVLAVLIATAPASAQSPRCAVTTFTDPPRQVLSCADGLTITAEKAADYRLVDSDGDGRPEAAELNGRALLIEFQSDARRGRFQILTPHAIASVRGTMFAVDVGPSRTSVFVKRGGVAVSRRGERGSVSLGAGDGVDVDAGQSGLKVNRWSAERAYHLMARFGR